MSTYYRPLVRDRLTNHLTEADLRTIIFDLGEDYNNFGGPDTTKPVRILNLLEHCEYRTNGLATLFAVIHHLRPDIELSSLPTPAPPTTPAGAPSVDPATLARAVQATDRAVKRIDAMTPQIDTALTGAPDRDHDYHLKIEGHGTAFVVKAGATVVQTVTGDDLAKLPADVFKHVSVVADSMEAHYQHWTALRRQRVAALSVEEKEKLDQQMRQSIAAMSLDLNDILSFLEYCGVMLDDHYMHIRYLVTQAATQP